MENTSQNNISQINYSNNQRTNQGRNTLANRAVNSVARLLFTHVYTPTFQDAWKFKNDCTFYKKTQELVDDIIQECINKARRDMRNHTGYDAPDLRCFVTNGYRDSVGLETVMFHIECSYEVADDNEGPYKHRNRVTQSVYVGKQSDRWRNHKNYEQRNVDLIWKAIDKYPIRRIDEVFQAQHEYDKLTEDIAKLKSKRRDFANKFGSQYIQ